MDRTLRTDSDIAANSSLFSRSVRLLVSAEAELVMRAETLPYLSDDLEPGERKVYEKMIKAQNRARKAKFK